MELSKILQKHKDLYLFYVDTGRVLFRLLDYKTYKTSQHVLSGYPEFKFDIEDSIWDECVLEHTLPNGKDDLDAGLVTTVAQLILYLSCPQSIEGINEQLEDARNLLTDAREQAILTICEAFPSYLPETLEEMSWSMISRRLAQAEFILKREIGFETTTSQQPSDSDRIIERLEEYTDEAVDFSRVNQELYSEEYGSPSGDFNLKNIRG